MIVKLNNIDLVFKLNWSFPASFPLYFRLYYSLHSL